VAQHGEEALDPGLVRPEAKGDHRELDVVGHGGGP
jgi:hypothetical protein